MLLEEWTSSPEIGSNSRVSGCNSYTNLIFLATKSQERGSCCPKSTKGIPVLFPLSFFPQFWHESGPQLRHCSCKGATGSQTWKQPRCLSEGKLWHIQTVEYSATKGNELSSNKIIWRNFKCLLVSEEANLKRLKTVWFPTLLHFGKGRTMRVKWSVLQGNIVNWLSQDPSKIPIQPVPLLLVISQ